MKRVILIFSVFSVLSFSNLYGEEKSPLEFYISTDIPVFYINVPDTRYMENFGYGTGLLSSSLSMNFGLFKGNIGFSGSFSFGFSGDVQNQGLVSYGGDHYFFFNFKIGPDICIHKGKHLVTLNFSLYFSYFKKLKGTEYEAVTDYDETYGTVNIESDPSEKQIGLVQFIRYDYFITDNFGLGPKFNFTEILDDTFIYSIELNIMYLF